MTETKTETRLEGKCDSCRWLNSHIPDYEGILAEDILSEGGRFPILKCSNLYSPEYRKYVSRSSSCDRYFKTTSPR